MASLRLEGENPGRPAGDLIHWVPWGDAAFDTAQRENKPVLLSISAVWCYWCQVMEDTSYRDPDVISYVNQHFVAVRVDNDHRPDINARYNVGGWPTTAFLTGHGGLIAGATYLPPDQLLAMMMEVQRAYTEQKPDLYDQGNKLLRQRQEEVAKVTAGNELDQVLVDRIARRAAGIYDPRNGGFGEEPKFPGVPILQLLLHLYRTTNQEFYRVMLEKSLDAMAQGGLFDLVEGGFFRYCAQADWSEPQHEKMLEDNVGLARVYLEAWLQLENQGYRQIAEQAIDYLLTHLYDQDSAGFRGSQGAHSDYFGWPLETRLGQTPPSVDPYCYASWSAQAASLLLEASWKLPRPDLVPVALRVLETLDGLARRGNLVHTYPAAGPEQESSGQFLTDWSSLLNALLDGLDYTDGGEKYLERANDVAGQMMERFFDQSHGGFYDIEMDPEAVGYLKVREKPLPENVMAVLGLLRLHQATLKEEYQQAAQRTLSAYVEANRAYGEVASGYARALDLFLSSPIEITVEGRSEDPQTQALLRAAARVPYPHLVIKLAAAAQSEAPAQAHICLDTVCLPPVSNPEALATAVAGALTRQESPFENILEKFPGF